MSLVARWAAILGLGLGALLACASDGQQPAADGQQAAAGPAAVVRIDNQSWFDVRAYLARGVSRSLLGSVTAGETAAFPVPADFLAGPAELTLVAEPIGSVQTFASEGFVIHPASTVEWTIRDQPAHSTLTVR